MTGGRRRNLRRPTVAAITAFLAAGSLLATDPLAGHSDRAAAWEAALPVGPEGWNGAVVGPRLGGIGEPRLPSRKTVVVETVTDLRAAVRAAEPGTVIEIHPGSYEFSGDKIEVNRPGLPDRPIVLRARTLASVRLRFSLLEGFHVLAPYWVFENLVIEGTCEDDSRCEHAFHVVGDAVGVVIQNNWIADFNAAIKVNGKGGRYPDAGTIRHNAFVNSRPRDTDRPVALLDLVSVSRWRVQKNLIADFAKAGGNYTSYGAFFKGAGEDNIFEQNLVRCEASHSGLDRIGFSFGDGGTGRRFCRDGSCEVEHRRGIARNNVIMDCPNRAGIYLSKSAETLIHNNALIATRGVELRGPGTDAVILNNIVDGGLIALEGATVTAAGNVLGSSDGASTGAVSSGIYFDPLGGDLRLKNSQTTVGRGVPVDGDWRDLCGQHQDDTSPDIGPIQYRPQSGCVQRLW